jgi:hypothetical protein
MAQHCALQILLTAKGTVNPRKKPIQEIREEEDREFDLGVLCALAVHI